MAASNRQRKSSSFLSVFGLFKKKGKGGYYESCDVVTKPWRTSDEDGGPCGPAEPGIDRKAEDFIARCRNGIIESELIQLDLAAADAAAEEEE